jgi:hypothetical protein
MKKTTAIASLLVSVFACIAQIHATPQQHEQEIIGQCVEKSQEHSSPN